MSQTNYLHILHAMKRKIIACLIGVSDSFSKSSTNGQTTSSSSPAATTQPTSSNIFASPRNALVMVLNANRERDYKDLPRRVIKVGEELGELSEAFLNVASARNGKKKQWKDVREEACDVAIVALDIALTPLPDEEDSYTQYVAVLDTFERKLTKWLATKANKTTTDLPKGA